LIFDFGLRIRETFAKLQTLGELMRTPDVIQMCSGRSRDRKLKTQTTKHQEQLTTSEFTPSTRSNAELRKLTTDHGQLTTPQ
jgi:hypothetical protein